MVTDPDVEGDKPTYAERATSSVANTNFKQITGVDPNITGLNTTGMTNSVDDLPIITQNKGSNTNNDSSKKGDSNGL